jgi:GNAT superfamily N-acetyltransferase
MKTTPGIEVQPLTPERWRAFAALFRSNRVTGGCWCMWFREPTNVFRAQEGAGNRDAFHRVVKGGPPPGVIATLEGRAVGWCAIAPREEYGRLQRSRTLAPVDDTPVWSITCFFIDPACRGRGVAAALIEGAAALAAAHGARVIEAYPVDPGDGRIGAEDAYHGVVSMFRSAGFTEAARRTGRRPIMRRTLGRARRPRVQP